MSDETLSQLVGVVVTSVLLEGDVVVRGLTPSEAYTSVRAVFGELR